MSLLSYFIPRTVLHFSTKYNHDIRVTEHSGTYRLLIEGATQTGPFMVDLWNSAFDYFHISSQMKIKSVLALGVGGGDIIRFISENFPGAKITGVDIDPAIIDISKQYFGLGQMENVHLVTQNAYTYILGTKDRFDLVIIDVFHGRRVPMFVLKLIFIQRVKRVLTKNGMLIINYMHDGKYEIRANELHKKLTSHFSRVSYQQKEFNVIFFARK